jgi:mannose-6-phosphate isomerase-like protein (cupin superfamily)
MSYTIKNLTELEDKAPQFGFDAVQEARFAHYDLGAESTGLSFLRVKPGCRQPFAHRHDEAEEIYVVLSGSGRVKLDEQVEEVKALDAIRVAPKVARQFEADGDGLELLALGPRHDRDAKMIEEGIF